MKRGCIHVAQLPKLSSVNSHRTFLAWELRWDFSALMRLVCGFILVHSARVLRESSTLHAMVGALVPFAIARGAIGAGVEMARLPAAVSMAVTAMTQGSPFVTAALVTVASACGLLLARGVRAVQASSVLNVLIGLLTPLIGALGQQVSAQFDDTTGQDPEGQLSVGLILAAFGVTCSAALWGWLLASHDEPTGEVSFTIGHDGRRIDALPSPPILQRCLGLALSCTGCVVLLRSTHCEALSISVFLAAAFWDDLAHFAVTRLGGASAASCEDFREPISQKAFEAQGQSCTAIAMAQLQRHLRENPKVIRSVADSSVNQLHRFSHCGGCDAS